MASDPPLRIQPLDLTEALIAPENGPIIDSSVQNEPSLENIPTAPPRPLKIYTRSQLLRLYRPNVQPPSEMPELKEWFGAENEQNLSKRDTEPPTPNSARDRRFRPDAKESELPARPSFRTALTQPSQMGNFKHQSLRTNDRDGDRDKERDIRDKEGQERLRNLSDKYDRERALPLSTLRNKERDPAPHLAAGSSRLSTTPAVAGRRAEPREVGKKKVGEGDDWRRAGESRRTGRDEQNVRTRSRSRARESSRPRRDRDREDRDTRKDKTRDETRKEDSRRDKEADEDDDPRRWRDDGKRDERMAARRDRGRDKPAHEPSAWTVVEERDGRNKRNTGRDKKAATGDEGRERPEKEKEPAWMDTYIPPPSSAGILGGQGAEGELDGIQVWKKGIKEKEQKDKDKNPPQASTQTTAKSDSQTPQLDEIQQFKLLMKREQERQNGDSDASHSAQALPESTLSGGNVPLITSGSTELSSSYIPASKSKSDLPVETPTQSLLSILTSGEPINISQLMKPNSTPESLDRVSTSSRFFPNPISQDPPQNSSDTPSNQFNPPSGSRLLALGSRGPQKQSINHSPSLVQQVNGVAPLQPQQYQQISQGPRDINPHGTVQDSSGNPPGFSPFEERRPSYGFEDQQRSQNNLSRRADGADAGSWPEGAGPDGFPANKGSRFAKFFDAKSRDASGPPKPQTPLGFASNSAPQRQDLGPGSHADHRAMDDLVAMLSNSAQQRPGQSNVTNPLNDIRDLSYNQQAQLQLLQQAQAQQAHHQLLSNSRHEPLYESRLDSRSFVPDGMVPGLRSAPAPRRDHNPGMFNEALDDAMGFNGQRIPPHRGHDTHYQGQLPSAYAQQTARNYRGGPSPISGQQANSRLPAGLANLGARPPHEPSQFPGMQGINSGGIHGSLHNGLSQQQFNNLSFPQQSQMRLPPIAPQFQSPVNLQQLGNLSHPSNLDHRSANQAQILGLGTREGFLPSQVQNSQLQNPLLMRQQQQQHSMLPPHLMAQHQQQQHLQQQTSSQHAPNDLMALLMSGTHRE
ncbi:hypothetical protein C8J56DRAFT_1159161 [Mycena floridula]|nr:hypothetical protein C8J56DRAFT_1159161 [Mycena floridula]